MQIEKPPLWTHLVATVVALAGVLVFRYFTGWSGIAGILSNAVVFLLAFVSLRLLLASRSSGRA